MSRKHREKIISQCSVVVTFRQKSPYDLDILGPLHAIPNLDFTKHVTPMDLFGGYRILHIDETSETVNVTVSEQNGTTKTLSVARGENSSFALGKSKSKSGGGSRGGSSSESFARTDGQSHDVGKSKSKEEGSTQSSNWSQNTGQNLDDHCRLNNYTASGGSGNSSGWKESESEGESVGHGWNASETTTDTDGNNWGRNWSDTDQNSRVYTYGDNQTITVGESGSVTHGVSQGLAETVNHRQIPLAFPERIYWPSSSLRMSVSDQIAMYKQIIATQRRGECLMLIQGRTIKVQVPVMREFCDQLKEHLIEEAKKEIGEREHYHIPDMRAEKWIGEPEIKKSTKSSQRTRAISDSSSSEDSSPATRWRDAGSTNSENGNGSNSSEPSS